MRLNLDDPFDFPEIQKSNSSSVGDKNPLSMTIKRDICPVVDRKLTTPMSPTEPQSINADLNRPETVDKTAKQTVKVPPVYATSQSHWKSHYSEELDRVITVMFDTEKITDHRRQQLNQVLDQVNETIRRSLKSPFRLDAFGSTENGFGSRKSDLDVCFRYEKEYDPDEEEWYKSMRFVFHTIAKALRSSNVNSNRFKQVTAITHTKVPIVKFCIRVENEDVEGDISYYNELALANTRLLKRYCTWTKDDVLSKLGMFIKRWAKECNIGDASKGSLSSYAYIILLVHFLQRLEPHPLLPVLQKMGEKKVIDVYGWDVYFCDEEPTPNWSQCTLSAGELFMQFLEYYTRFDWNNLVVQIYQIKALTKETNGWNKVMCIEDPFEYEHNLASGISDRMFVVIKKAFVNSRDVFFSLDERRVFLKECGRGNEEADDPIDKSLIARYGNALLDKCRTSIGEAPKKCFKCDGLDHFTTTCTKNVPAQRGGSHSGRGGRGKRGAKKDVNRSCGEEACIRSNTV